MHTKTIAELIQGLRAKEFSSEELTRCYLDRIKSFDKQVNSFVTITEEQAMQAAKQADKRLSDGTAELLTGVPLAQKDIFCTSGVKTSCGSKMLDNFIAPYDATTVERFNKRGW